MTKLPEQQSKQPTKQKSEQLPKQQPRQKPKKHKKLKLVTMKTTTTTTTYTISRDDELVAKATRRLKIAKSIQSSEVIFYCFSKTTTFLGSPLYLRGRAMILHAPCPKFKPRRSQKH